MQDFGQELVSALLLNGGSLFKNAFFPSRKNLPLLLLPKFLFRFLWGPTIFLLDFFIRSSVCLARLKQSFLLLHSASLFEKTLLEQENVYESQKQKIVSNKNTLSPKSWPQKPKSFIIINMNETCDLIR
jgi:hypothetical protein